MNTNTASQFEIQNQPEFSVIRFFNFVDAGTIEHIHPLITEKIPAACVNIIIDLEKVEFLDSHGVGFFVSLLKKAHGNKGRLFFSGATAQPASVLNMVGFNGPHIVHCKNFQQARDILEKNL